MKKKQTTDEPAQFESKSKNQRRRNPNQKTRLGSSPAFNEGYSNLRKYKPEVVG
ncbi:MAG: hypothetical protein WA584_05930 [Pyrinomonadaceae bacterium]